MSGYRPQGLLAIGVAVGLSACSDPTLNTDLRPEGPPEVTTAMVMTDIISSTPGGDVPIEHAVACADGDEERPTWIGLPNQDIIKVCPDDETPDSNPTLEVTNADPLIWQVRVVFDELLDGDDIETLTDAMGGSCDEGELCVGHIAAADPFSIDCGGTATNVAYDGYYSPNGNNVSWPPGPSIVGQPLDFVATGSHCVATLNTANVHDKDGNEADNALGNFEFDIAALAILATDPDPADAGAEEPPDFTPSITFNAPVDATSVDAADITLTGPGGAVAFTVEADGTSFVIVPDADLAVGDYTLTIAGAAEFADIAGGASTVGDDIVITFTVVAA
jgi:hypothetical protein